MTLPKHALPFIALVISAVIWGAAAPIAKITLTEIPLFIITFFRFLTATAVLAIIISKFGFHTPIRRKHLLLLISVGLLDSTINLALGYSGLSLTTALDVIAIGATGPILAAIASVIFLKESLTRFNILGQLLALGGVLLVMTAPTNGDAPNRLLGDLLTLGAVLAAVAGLILAKELFRTYHALTVTATIFLVGAISSAPLAAADHLQNPQWFEAVSTGAWLGLGFLVIFSSVVAYLAFQWGLEHSTASAAGISGHFSVLTGAFLATILLSEVLSTGFVLGASLIIIGVVLATRPAHHYRRAHLR